MKYEWIYTIIATIIFGLLGLTYNNLVTKIDRLEKDLQEKVNVLNKKVDHHKVRLDDHQKRLINTPLPCKGSCPLY